MKLNLRAWEVVWLCAAAQVANAISVDIDNTDSVKAATSKIAYGLLKYYTGNVTNTPETIAVLGPPYYWWEGGAMWGAMIDYHRLTGDSSYINTTYEALLSQVGPDYDFMVPLRVKELGNDDQAFWGFATMTAAEYNWQAPPSPVPSWLQLTINLWNTQVRRWDLETCNGGLKWQIYDFNNGYDYKNSISNMAFFQLSARLARYTGNITYLEWAEKSWDWSARIGLLSPDYHIYDGTDDKKNCSDLNHLEFSYSNGVAMYGAAALYNYTNGSSIWEERVKGLIKGSALFFSPYDNATNIMYEQACETVVTCNYDMLSFKAYLSRFMWATTILAPFTKDAISTLLRTSAVAAAGSCVGGASGEECGHKWYVGGSDGLYGPGQQLGALELLQGLLAAQTGPPLTSKEVVLSSPVVPEVIAIPSATPTGDKLPPSAASARALAITTLLVTLPFLIGSSLVL